MMGYPYYWGEIAIKYRQFGIAPFCEHLYFCTRKIKIKLKTLGI